MRDANAPMFKLGVVGAGAMGSGIAQVAVVGGIETRIFDARAEAAEQARLGIGARLGKRANDGKMDSAEAEAATGRLSVAQELGALTDCDVVIEAIIEDLGAKQDLFSRLEKIVGADCILASNTSSLPIGAIGTRLERRERIAGMHFFNPVPVMKLVEVIRGPDTHQAVIDALMSLGRLMGRTPVVAKDTPGFLVNFGGRAFATEGLAIVHEGVATPAQVDAIMRDCCGFRMGPFELMDLTGIDVNFPVTRFIHESFFGDPRLRSTPLHRYLLESGHLGRKTGQGFFDYGGGKPDLSSADVPSTDTPAKAVVLKEPDDALLALARETGAEILEADDGVSPILAAPVGEDCAAFSARTGADHRRLIALDLAADTSKRITVMTAPGADSGVRQSIVDLFAKARAVTAIADSPGFVAQRITAMVANLGCEMAQIGLAAPDDIDTAMRLGLNYPRGPLELADILGPATIHRILSELQRLTGDDRYRPSQWLRRRATLGLSAKAV